MGLAAIAAGSAFGMKAGVVMILPLLLTIVTIDKGVEMGGHARRADVEATGAGGSTTMAILAI